MLLAESTILYRLSRSELVRRRALRRIIRCEEQMRRLCGEDAAPRDRRREPRQSFQVPINLRPARVRGLTIRPALDAEPFLAVTSNFSLSGLGLVHDEPLPASLFLAEFDVFEPEPLRLVVELCWTEHLLPYSHRSGGRILGVARARTEEAEAE